MHATLVALLSGLLAGRPDPDPLGLALRAAETATPLAVKRRGLQPAKDYDGKPIIHEVIPGRLVHMRMVVQADKSEFDLLAIYAPDEARRLEIKTFWHVLHAEALRLGDLVCIVGDFNAEPARAGARRTQAASHRALADGLMQWMMRDLDLRYRSG